MEYSEDAKRIEEWMPLVMEGRDPNEEVTAPRMVTGTDVNYGALTEELFDSLRDTPGFLIHFFHRVQDLRREGDLWNVRVRDEKTGRHRDVRAKFIFIGAGGGSLPLLQKSGIPEGRGYAGFPVSGIWLRCDRPDISSRHNAKVCGKVAVGSPRCPCLISTPVKSTERFLCFSVRTPDSRQSFSSMAPTSTSSAPSIPKICCR
jgi:malate dehydrogenase (quinone)